MLRCRLLPKLPSRNKIYNIDPEDKSQRPVASGLWCRFRVAGISRRLSRVAVRGLCHMWRRSVSRMRRRIYRPSLRLCLHPRLQQIFSRMDFRRLCQCLQMSHKQP
ncbi:hypothetical protein D9615_010650 [Tricholomella constricta]|uniref:Uncharacterized protein n=1 Tax=Tricholomella constricta TaxID=117010 RepID=A0A8H5GJH4_9AGAR|nr:hypothetical protein D9615_010650 [Tricholomella constricta]